MSETPPPQLKQIVIKNPEAFTISGSRKTRKRGSNEGGVAPAPRIKLKSDQTIKQVSNRQKILRALREKQASSAKQYDGGDGFSEFDNKSIETFQSEFNNSLNYLTNLSKDPTSSSAGGSSHLGGTLRHNPSPLGGTSILVHTPSNVPPSKDVKPEWGCLKNGTLKTYRQYSKSLVPDVLSTNSVNVMSGDSGPSLMLDMNPMPATVATSVPISVVSPVLKSTPTSTPPLPKQDDNSGVAKEKRFLEQLFRHEKEAQIQTKSENVLYPIETKRKFLRQTYRAGKQPNGRIAVMVHNRTQRNQIMTHSQRLKDIPLHDVKTFLIRKGFIKTVSTAPPDVLRKMYESVALVNGEVKNHNEETMLANFLDTSKG